MYLCSSFQATSAIDKLENLMIDADVDHAIQLATNDGFWKKRHGGTSGYSKRWASHDGERTVRPFKRLCHSSWSAPTARRHAARRVPNALRVTQVADLDVVKTFAKSGLHLLKLMGKLEERDSGLMRAIGCARESDANKPHDGDSATLAADKVTRKAEADDHIESLYGRLRRSHFYEQYVEQQAVYGLMTKPTTSAELQASVAGDKVREEAVRARMKAEVEGSFDKMLNTFLEKRPAYMPNKEFMDKNVMEVESSRVERMAKNNCRYRVWNTSVGPSAQDVSDAKGEASDPNELVVFQSNAPPGSVGTSVAPVVLGHNTMEGK